MANYGIPYMGSKARIAKEIVGLLPKADTLVDLFAGGCAITHAAIKMSKWKNVLSNDIDWMPLDLFKRALNGEFKNEKRFISKEEFDEKKDSDPYIRYCWSFGNKGGEYLYGKEIAPFKEAIHEFYVNGDFALLKNMGYDEETFLRDKKDNPKAIWMHYKNRYGILHTYEAKALLIYEVLNRLKRLNSIIGGGKMPTFSNKSYDEVEISDNSVIYCDIPYDNTAEYRVGGFDHKKFYEWCGKQDKPLFISSYEMPDTFKCVWQKKIGALLASSGNSTTIERVFTPIHQYERNKILINEQGSLF